MKSVQHYLFQAKFWNSFYNTATFVNIRVNIDCENKWKAALSEALELETSQFELTEISWIGEG